ncbi:hypothetical protein CIB93_19425 [Streptomyces sp. WZ.A104]|uniref:hypothetical protein n=1 Tax=Streptomyces sp. WZ.A104 TaxID=2023771 RepID=UPI000BBCC646|nr:hypothetical protein [Streptomyces sp. WZ.A104]PCG84409.1 hypothetical protein CIB93_19425 [Streptomyces sp. WZ.A104]
MTQETHGAQSRILERYDTTAVNCLTGGYSALATVLGRPVAEQAIFERGNGYLFQAGLDEGGYPEYIFPVEEAGALGMTRSGFKVHTIPIEPAAMGDQLVRLLAEFKGVVVWVNTAHLGYADVYTGNAPYLHAVLIEGVSEDLRHVDVLDTLVVGPKPFSCRARLSIEDLVRATTDHIRTESHDGMGFFYAATDTLAAAGPGEGAGDGALDGVLAEQARRFFAEERFRGAINRYRDLSAACFAGTREQAAIGARRLFHHSSVLYAVPSLVLMGRSLADAGAGEDTTALHEEAMRHWQAMGVLALRYEATAAPSVLGRINERFARLDEVTVRLWESLIGR